MYLQTRRLLLSHAFCSIQMFITYPHPKMGFKVSERVAY